MQTNCVFCGLGCILQPTEYHIKVVFLSHLYTIVHNFIVVLL